jgi:spermidine/putrescine transport system substrate-binding protein
MRSLISRALIVLGWIAIILALILWPQIPAVSRHSRTINIFTWGDILEPSSIISFEKETGIKINLNYYASNEELLVKMKATGGKGYDLIIPSDYAVEILIKEGLLKPLDRSKLTFLDQLNPLLLHHYFDPDNRYSVPFSWEVYGYGIDREFFEGKGNPSLKWIFDPKIINYRISMVNDPIDATLFASRYLFGPEGLTILDDDQIELVKNLLIAQKKMVIAYATTRADYFLATRNCPIAVTSSSYIWRSLKQFPFIEFVIPEEQAFINVENFAITAASNKENQIYKFMNYFYKNEIIARHYLHYGIFPPTLDALVNIEQEDVQEAQFLRRILENLKDLSFFKQVIPDQQLRELWVEVKGE